MAQAGVPVTVEDFDVENLRDEEAAPFPAIRKS